MNPAPYNCGSEGAVAYNYGKAMEAVRNFVRGLTRQEVAGAFGDIGTLVPLAVTLIQVNHLNPTVVFGVAGALYIWSGLYYRLPVPVQPLKSFSALAIALGLSARVLSAGGALMGALLLAIGVTGISEYLGKIFTKPLVRGIQLGIGLILLKAGLKMALSPVPNSAGLAYLGILLAVVTAGLLWALANSRTVPAGLVIVGFGLAAGIILKGFPTLGFGPAPMQFVLPGANEFSQAFVLLVLPQLPLTLTNSVVAMRDVARTYFKERAGRVTFRMLCVDLGIANLVAGFGAGMPVCHGSGGLTAHYRLGARTGASVVFIGIILLVVGVGFGPSAAAICSLIPLPVLGVLLAYVGAAHALLIRDTVGNFHWLVVLSMGLVAGYYNHNGYGLAAGAALYAARWLWERLRSATTN